MELKCPWCGTPLSSAPVRNPKGLARIDLYWCGNHECESSSGMVGTDDMWGAVIASKKQILQALKDWGIESDSANDCIIEILGSYLDFLLLVINKRHCPPDYLHEQACMLHNKWSDFLELCKKTKEVSQETAKS